MLLTASLGKFHDCQGPSLSVRDIPSMQQRWSQYVSLLIQDRKVNIFWGSTFPVTGFGYVPRPKYVPTISRRERMDYEW